MTSHASIWRCWPAVKCLGSNWMATPISGDGEPDEAEDQGEDGGGAAAPPRRAAATPAAAVRPVGIHPVTVHLVALAPVNVYPGHAAPLITACLGIRRHKENGRARFRRLDGPEGLMPWFDLPLDQLREYRTDTAEPPELDLWWQLRLGRGPRRGAARPL